MKQFVPVEDEFPAEPRRGVRRLVPYHPGMACHHAWQRDSAEAEPDRVVCGPRSERAESQQESALLDQKVLCKPGWSR